MRIPILQHYKEQKLLLEILSRDLQTLLLLDRVLVMVMPLPTSNSNNHSSSIKHTSDRRHVGSSATVMCVPCVGPWAVSGISV